MPIFLITMLAAITSLAIHGALFFFAIVKRVSVLGAPKDPEKSSIFKKIAGVFILTLVSPFVGLGILSAGFRHGAAGGFIKAALDSRDVSLEDERALIQWLNDTYPIKGS